VKAGTDSVALLMHHDGIAGAGQHDSARQARWSRTNDPYRRSIVSGPSGPCLSVHGLVSLPRGISAGGRT
jgi:hypothetical protein